MATRPKPAFKIKPTGFRSAAAVAPTGSGRRQTVPTTKIDSEKTNNLIKRMKYPTIIPEQSVISVYSNEQMKRISGVNVTNPSFEGTNSVNDIRMGSVDLKYACGKCDVYDCPGHYGYIDFKGKMIYHPLFIKDYIVPLLKVTCNCCSRLLFNEEYMIAHSLTRKKPSEKLAELAKAAESRGCLHTYDAPRCEGKIIKCAMNPVFDSTDVEKTGTIKYKVNPQATSVEPMPITKAYQIFSQMIPEDLKLLGFNSDSHPINFILQGILVAPNIARAPNYTDGKKREDQLTDKYKSIVEIVESFNDQEMDKVSTEKLYSMYRQFIFKEDKENNSGIEYQSIIMRIQGKKALLRESLMGKRNNYTGRTVAGPDGSLPFGYMSVPSIWAPVLIKKVKVTTLNYDSLNQKLQEGKIPTIIDKQTGMKFDSALRKKIVVGDTVCRFMEDGDWVVINRQPTLTKQSMMAYRAQLKPQLTIGNHLSVCGPMNLDFDGDEENLWDVLDNMVKAECMFVMNAVYNIMSESQNKPLMGLVMNSVTGSYLLNRTEEPMSEVLFNSLLDIITCRDGFPTLFERLERHGVHPCSGPAVFSALLPPDFHLGDDKDFIPKDYTGDLADLPRGSTPVKIRQGVLITGKVTKAHVGAAHRSIIQELWKDYGAERTAMFLTDAPWVMNKWIFENGFSVSLRDCVNFAIDPDTGKEIDLNLQVLDSELAQLRVSLKALGPKADDPLEEKFRQQKILENVDLVKGVGVSLAEKVLTENNRIGIMTAKGAGTKGDKFNLAQIMSAVGQQMFNGDRIQPETSGGRRTLPMFDIDDERPESQGLIVHSFLYGVRPEELFFMHEAGRQSLMDTALNTAKVGSIQHKLIKATEGIVIAYNGAIVNTNGTIFSTSSNCGYSVASVINVNHPTKETLTFFADVSSEVSKLNASVGKYSKDIYRLVEAKRARLQAMGVRPPNMIIDMNAPQPNYRRIPTGQTRDGFALTCYETARIVGTRATQLENDAPTVLTDEERNGAVDPFDIALLEYNLNKCPVFAIRKRSNQPPEEVYPTANNK